MTTKTTRKPATRKPAPVNPSPFQTIIISVITAGILFIAGNILTARGTESAVAVKLENISQQVSELKTQVSVLNGQLIRREECTELEHRVRTLENKR